MKRVKVAFAGLLVIMTLLAMVAPAHADHVTITPSSADTYIDEFHNTNNYGTSTELDVFPDMTAPGYLMRSLVTFDLSSIPSGSTINLAYLQLYYFGNLNLAPTGRTYTANRVTTNWVEGNGINTGASWIQPDLAVAIAWTTLGGDFTTTGAASHTIIAGDLGNYVTWDVTTIVKAWIEGGQANYGFLIKDANEVAFGAVVAPGPRFYSKEEGSNMPILKIDYTPPTTATTATTATTPPAKLAVAHVPVGGVMLPSVGFTVLLPWAIALSLLGVLSVETFLVKRRAKRR